MQAIILAAGRGTRLKTALKGQPKCLAPIHQSMKLLDYQINILHSLGITDIGIVLGYRAHAIYRVMGDLGHPILNRRYAETNSLYSLWLARDWVQDDCLIMNSDILAHPSIYKRLLKGPSDALVYDSWSGNEAEQMKVAFQRGKLHQINKSMEANHAQGESVGLLKFSQSTMQQLFLEAKTALALEGENQWAPAAIARLAQHKTITGLDIAGLPWVEIDFPEDLSLARKTVWPMIAPAAMKQFAKVQYQAG